MIISLKNGPRVKESDIFSHKSGKYRTLTHSLMTSPRESAKSRTIENRALSQSINDPVLRQYINTDLDDYFDTKLKSNHHKCIDCAKCLLPTGGKMIRYKYPQNVCSGKSNFPRFQGQPVEPRVSFNYDDFRK